MMGPGTQYPSISVTHLQQPANLTTLLRPGREEVRYEKIKGNCSCVSVAVALSDQMPLGALTHVELCLLPKSETRALGHLSRCVCTRESFSSQKIMASL